MEELLLVEAVAQLLQVCIAYCFCSCLPVAHADVGSRSKGICPSTCADAAKGQLSHQPVVIVNVIILPVRGKSHQTVALYDVLLSVLQAALLRRRQRRRRRSLKRSLTRYNPISSSSLSLNEAFTIMRLHIDCAWDSKQSCLLCGMHIVARSKHAWFPVAPDFGWHLSNLVMICSFCYLQDMGFSLFD